jgi:hypothetical protein
LRRRNIDLTGERHGRLLFDLSNHVISLEYPFLVIFEALWLAKKMGRPYKFHLFFLPICSITTLLNDGSKP